MVVALSFHSGDVHLADDLLRWIGKLSDVSEFDCILVVDANTPFDKASDIKARAEQCFRSATLVSTEKSVTGWPAGPNENWRTAIAWGRSNNVPILFLETDAIPLKPTWLHELATAYAASSRQHFGQIEANSNTQLPAACLSGVAVYGPRTNWPLLETPRGFNVDYADLLIPDSTHTRLIQDFFGQPNKPPLFTEIPLAENHVTLSFLNPDAVIFHRDKRHSLIPLLAKREGIAWAPTVTEKLFHVPTAGHADYVSLRRAGDIINLLPALYKRARVWKRAVRLVVHREFVPLVHGLSYVEPMQWDGDWEDPLAAAHQFRAKSAQVFGKGIFLNIAGENYAKLAWKHLGMKFNRYAPLVLDNRDAERESLLASRTFQTDKPKILIKLHGFSSPMGEAGWIREKLSMFSERAELIWLDKVKAERLIDILGLMDRAHGILTIDTSILHLCQATPTPCIQFVNGPGFPASPPRGNVILRLNYRETLQRWREVEQALNKMLTITQHGNAKVLVFQAYRPPDPEARRRQDEAYKSWPHLGARLLPFLGKRHSGDGRNMPFVRDMIHAAADGPEDIIVISNNDIIFDPRIAASIDESCRQTGCWWAYRLDRPGGRTDEGADTFAFTKSWWHLHEHLFPDLLLGYYNWDDILVRMMHWSGCFEQERLIYHTPHPSTQSPTRLHTTGARHNQFLMQQWITQHDEGWEKPRP